MAHIEIPYGNDRLGFEVAGDIQVSVVNPRPSRPLRDLGRAVVKALESLSLKGKIKIEQ